MARDAEVAAANRLAALLSAWINEQGEEAGIMLTALAWAQGTMVAQLMALDPLQARQLLRRVNTAALTVMERELAARSAPGGAALLRAIPAGQA